MTQLLDESYLEWLYSQVADIRIRVRSRTYWSLLRQLYTKEFVWYVPNDDNRVEDGRELRYEFIKARRLRDVDENWLGLECSMLELLIGISRRLSFEAEGESAIWFWHLLDNLQIARFNDREYDPDEMWISELIDGVLDNVIERRYHYDGRGGLFPLRQPDEDQTQVELWYQLNAYVLELGDV